MAVSTNPDHGYGSGNIQVLQVDVMTGVPMILTIPDSAEIDFSRYFCQ